MDLTTGPGTSTDTTNVPEDHISNARQSLVSYYAMIESLDWNLGRLLDHIQRLDLDKKTIVVFTSDHGDMMLSHGCNWKRRPFEESIRVPFIIRWPDGITSGRECNNLFSLIDIAPTIRDLLSIPRRKSDGVSHASLMRGHKEKFSSESVYLSCHWLGCREYDQVPQKKRPIPRICQ